MTPLDWIEILGIPTLIIWMWQHIKTRIKKTADDNAAVKKGVQALLRAQMIADYNKWMEREYAPIYVRENFENCWEQYEALGENGVMTDLHDKFLSLPTSKPKTRKEDVT